MPIAWGSAIRPGLQGCETTDPWAGHRYAHGSSRHGVESAGTFPYNWAEGSSCGRCSSCGGPFCGTRAREHGLAGAFCRADIQEYGEEELVGWKWARWTRIHMDGVASEGSGSLSGCPNSICVLCCMTTVSSAAAVAAPCWWQGSCARGGAATGWFCAIERDTETDRQGCARGLEQGGLSLHWRVAAWTQVCYRRWWCWQNSPSAAAHE